MRNLELTLLTCIFSEIHNAKIKENMHLGVFKNLYPFFDSFYDVLV